MRTALIQMTSTDDPLSNLGDLSARITDAAESGAGFILTPEVCNCISTSRRHQQEVLRHEADDPTLAGIRDLAARHGVWIVLGSLALKTDDTDGRFANRSFAISPDGDIAGRYDKIHMFDVDISETESYRESSGYRPGERLTLIETPFGKVGLTICYDLRFPHIFRALSQAGADFLSIPAAFSPATGRAHWEPLLRARAIENGAYVLAPAQTGTHPSQNGRTRATFGHTMAVDPWGKILETSATKPVTIYLDIKVTEVQKARHRVPSLLHDRIFEGPK